MTIVNAYMVYGLDFLERLIQYAYSGYGIAFDGKGYWSFNDCTARNFIIFGVNNISSSHTDNLKNDFLNLVEGDAFGIGGTFDAPKNININFSKAKKKFCSSFNYKSDNSYLYVNGKETYAFKARNKNNNFPFQFCLGSISNKIDSVESKEVFVIKNVYDFSVDHYAIDKSNILNIHKYLMIQNGI